MESIESDWKELEKEFEQFQKRHIEYVKKLEEVELMKKTDLEKFLKLKKKLNGINKSIKYQEKSRAKSDEQKSDESNQQDTGDSVRDENAEKLQALKKKIDENLNYMSQISDTFPRPNSLYLKVIIGGVNVSILNKEEKWNYKEEYEKFKYNVTIISLLSAFILIFIPNSRVLDAMFNFLLVWYYCTLTIRESILVVNGSRQESESYNMFRQQFIWFSFYLSFVQLLQYYYQKGCLYRLRALGEKEDMDTTVEGFQSWMLRGLSFLLPFLFFGYFWELYNSYVLYTIAMSGAKEWQVYALSLIFFILFSGNFLTTYMVIRKKFRARISDQLVWLKYKYYSIIPRDKKSSAGDDKTA